MARHYRACNRSRATSLIELAHQLLPQTVILPTIRRTQGATTATVGKATGHVVAQLLSHCVTNPACSPWEIISTKADTMQTMMAESNALKRMGAKRAGIRMLFSWKLINGLKSVLIVVN